MLPRVLCAGPKGLLRAAPGLLSTAAAGVLPAAGLLRLLVKRRRRAEPGPLRQNSEAPERRPGEGVREVSAKASDESGRAGRCVRGVVLWPE